MKCAIYARASTDEQGTSIVNQQEYFKKYIEQNNFEIFDVYSDEAFSGTETTKRLSFQRLLEDGKNKRYDVLLAKSYSRFGRNQRETLTALAELFEHGIRIIFVEDGLDSLRDKGQFGLFAWLAEQESRKISERIKMTWQLYNKQGKIHNTNEPFGYNYNPAIKNFEVNENEAKTVKMIFDMYLRGKGTRHIAVYLGKNGFPSKRNKKWHNTAISHIITNEFYLGHLAQGKSRKIDVTIKKVEQLDKKHWIIHKNNHEAIISEEIFQRAQEEFAKRAEYMKQRRRTRHSQAHLFSNLIKCALCGASCISRLRRTGYTELAYSCKDYDLYGVGGCGHKRNAILEQDLMLDVKAGLDVLAENDYKTVKDYFRKNNAVKRRERSKLDIDSIDKQIEEQTRLGNSLLSLFTEGIIGKEQFKLQNNSIADTLTALMKQREELLFEQNKLSANIDDEAETIKAVKDLLTTDLKDWTNDKVKKVINRINLDNTTKTMEIVYNFNVVEG